MVLSSQYGLLLSAVLASYTVIRYLWLLSVYRDLPHQMFAMIDVSLLPYVLCRHAICADLT